MNGVRQGVFFSASRGLTESLWVIAFAGATLHGALQARFSIAAGVLSFVCAALVTRFTRHRGMLRITALLIHIVCLGACAVTALWAAGLWTRAFLDGPWWSLQGVAGILTLCWVLVLWWKGNALIRKPATHDRVCEQFDKGITAFGAIFLIAAFVGIKWGVVISWAPAFPLFGVFFLAGLASMGLSPSAWNEPPSPRHRPGAGAFILFGLLILGVGLGTIGLFMPILEKGAELGLYALKTTTSPMGPLLVRILRFIFAPRNFSPREDASPPAGAGADLLSPGGERDPGVLEWILGWGVAGLVISLAAAATCVLLYFAVKALFSRNAARGREHSAGMPFILFLQRLLQLIGGFSLRKTIGDLLYPRPLKVYQKLNRWGRRTGIPRRPSETPFEYGRRLSGAFSGLSREIHALVDLVNADAYGGDPVGRQGRASARRAWRSIRSPVYWPVRAKFLLLGRSVGLSRGNGWIMLFLIKIQGLRPKAR